MSEVRKTVGMSVTHSLQRRGEESISNFSQKTSTEEPTVKSVGVYRRIILKWILDKLDVTVKNGLI